MTVANSAETYEKEYVYWPWGSVIDFVNSWVEKNARESSTILDYMCGTGYLLNQIVLHRPDITCFGCSLNQNFIEYANRHYKNINVVYQDAFQYVPSIKPDIIICTAGLHHLHWNQHKTFIQKVASELDSNEYFILGEELIRTNTNDKNRRMAVLELHSELLKYMILMDAPPELIDAGINILTSDIFISDEYKLCRSSIIDLLKADFIIEAIEHVWPTDCDAFGDEVFICRKR